MHRVLVMIPARTLAHTVSEGVGAEQEGRISTHTHFMHEFEMCKSGEKNCICLKYLPGAVLTAMNGAEHSESTFRALKRDVCG